MRAVWGWEAEPGVVQPRAKECRSCQLPAEGRRKAGRGFSGRASRGTLSLDSWPLELWENEFLLFQAAEFAVPCDGGPRPPIHAPATSVWSASVTCFLLPIQESAHHALHQCALSSCLCLLRAPMLPRPVHHPLNSSVPIAPSSLNAHSHRVYIQRSAAHARLVLCCTYMLPPLMFGNMPCSALNLLECLAQTFIYSQASKYVESSCMASFAMRQILFLFHNLGMKLCMQKKLKPWEK